ncbi:MAG: translation initiation factor 1 [Oleispira sp.]|jgi:translation initiation factor 1
MSKKAVGLAGLAGLTGLGNKESVDNNEQTQSHSGSVYSTEVGRVCPGCGKAKGQCACTLDALPEGDGIVRIQRETKGRKGKGVTLIKGILLAPSELKALAKELKQKCGVGGAVKDGVIEIQGDVRDQLFEEMQQRGFKVKKAGG